MINVDTFNEIIQNTREFKYSSLNYIEFSDYVNAEVLYNNNDLVMLHDRSKSPEVLFFATNDFETVINATSELPSSKLRLHFVPHEYAARLKDLGFSEWGEYADFWNEDLVSTSRYLGNICEPKFLVKEECEEVSLLSQRCRLQSRGFEGESAEWFMEWLDENKVIVWREGEEIVGYCCVSIYNEGTTLWIREIAADPTFQGKGFGKKLMEQAILYGVSNGAVKGFLAADILNENAIGLYRKYDFHIKGTDSELQMIRE